MRPTFSSRSALFSFVTLSLAGVAVACGSDTPTGNNVTCGSGTTLQGTVCVPTPGGQVDGGVIVTGPTAPTFGGATSAAPASATSLQVTWVPATDATTATARLKYNVYVATTKGGQNFGVPTSVSPPGATSQLITGLTANTEYFVVVRAVNPANLEEKNTTEKSAKPQADTGAPAFTGVTKAEPAAGGSVTLSWDAAQDDLTPKEGLTYLAYASDTAGGENFAIPDAVSDPGATSVVVKGLPKPNGSYFFVVRARDAAGNVDLNKKEVAGKSGADTDSPLFAGCASATTKDASSVTVTWAPALDDSTPATKIAYDVYTSKTPGKEDYTNPAATFTGGVLGVVTGLSQSTSYYFVCRARDLSNNADANTAERSATTLADGTPPTFAGISSISNISATGVDLNWTAATDNQSAPEDIVYDVFEATSAAGENFSGSPKVTSVPGATKITLAGLTPATTLYWVVRARDIAGNRDANLVEKNVATGVSFSANVEPIFGSHCALTGCHLGNNPPNGLALSQVFDYLDTVNVTSVEVSTLKRVLPGSAANSYLFKKISGTHSVGEIMPPPSTNDVLNATEKSIIEGWINQGALRN